MERDKKYVEKNDKSEKKKKNKWKTKPDKAAQIKKPTDFAFFGAEKWKCFFGDKFHSM
jgi:hypothetical protein